MLDDVDCSVAFRRGQPIALIRIRDLLIFIQGLHDFMGGPRIEVFS
jgi:hypothetical protein